MNRRVVPRRFVMAIVVTLMAGLMAACGGGGGSKDAAADLGEELVGLLRLTPGAANGESVTGSYFRMLQPGADPKKGPFMVNSDSPALNGEATMLTPGLSGGLRTGGYQSQPNPPFRIVEGKSTDSLSDAINVPVKWFGVDFSISTNKVDPQTLSDVPPPTVWFKDGKLNADVSAWHASWNGQEFNQGAPKPIPNTDAKAAGQEKAEKTWDWVAQKFLESAPKSTLKGNGATGTYDPATRAFTLEWTSLIEGGPFDSFTGLWHLEGVFEPSGRAPDGK